LSSVAGLRATLTVLALAIAVHLHALAAPPEVAWLASDTTLWIAGVATICDVFGDKIPLLDHALHAGDVVARSRSSRSLQRVASRVPFAAGARPSRSRQHQRASASNQLGMAPTLETPRLILRPWRDADIADWTAMGADEDVMEFFPSTYDRAKAESLATWMRERLEADGYGWWAVEIKDGAPFAGVIALQDVPFEAHFTPALEVGWRLARPHWGHGYATEGARAALKFAFEDLDRDEVIAMTASINLRSERVMQRLGMTRDAGDDFDHPRLERGHRLSRHVLYRASRTVVM
jgi:RimJ/RimL family protein N-acetyltransferase